MENPVKPLDFFGRVCYSMPNTEQGVDEDGQMPSSFREPAVGASRQSSI